MMKICIFLFCSIITFQLTAQLEYEIIQVNDSIFDDYFLLKVKNNLDELLVVVERDKWDKNTQIGDVRTILLSNNQDFYPKMNGLTYRFEDLIIYHYGETYYLRDIIIVDRIQDR